MAFPSTPLIDGFNRADENPLSDGGKWSLGPLDFTAGRTLRLVSNEATAAVAGSSNSYRNDQNYGPDTEVYAKLTGSTNDTYLFARCVNIGAGTTDGYCVRFSYPTGSLTFYRITDCIFSSLSSAISISLNAGDEVGFAIAGSTLKAYRKPLAGSWTELDSVIDSTYSAAGKNGAYSAAGRIDNFSGGTVPTRFSVTSSSYTVTVGTSATVSAQLEDDNGIPNALAGLTVDWSATSGSLSSATSVTNGSGIATITCSPTVRTTATVTATSGSYTGTSPTITSVFGPPSALTSRITSNPSTIPCDGVSTSTIAVESKDAYNNVLDSGGATVTLASTHGTLSDVTDQGNGNYTAALTSSLVEEIATVTGTLNGTAITDDELVTFMVVAIPNPDNFLRPRPVRGNLRIT